jgi:hypothetical protein
MSLRVICRIFIRGVRYNSTGGRQDFEPICPISKNELTIDFEAVSTIMNYPRSGQFFPVNILAPSFFLSFTHPCLHPFFFTFFFFISLHL